MPALAAAAPAASWSIYPLAQATAALAPCLLLVGDRDAPQADDIDAIADLATAHGCGTVSVCRGHSGDERTRREHLRALADEYDRLRARACALHAPVEPPVWVIASGYGAYLATLLSQRRAIDRMLLRSPRVYPDAGWDLPKAQLDDRLARSPSPFRLAPNDNLALCAAGQYLGQVWIVDSPGEDLAHHSLHVDYFHAFSRARDRNLATLGRAPAGVTTAEPGDDFRDTVARWLDTQG
ncbi:hypothetical protein [Xenophilus sp. Marseille-Q4582]|uniref:hypothetical protein n=1 Tax=Xenophilus sp. Marseille-Q4582 TaxID=2866600 RepID=UPI001CE3F644|nr:hypothetical protein [Xenophilus sp. Marseille-Q4582]